MHHYTTLAIILAMLIATEMANIPKETTTINATQTNNFNVLLNLYKMNPLKTSEVFREFSHRMLIPNKELQLDDAVMNFDSSESAKNRKSGVNMNTKLIEDIDIVYATKAPQSRIRKPDFIIENIDRNEKWSVPLQLHDGHQEDKKNTVYDYSKKGEDFFSSMITYLDSVENDDGKVKVVTVKDKVTRTQSNFHNDPFESNLIHAPDHYKAQTSKFSEKAADEGIVVLR